MNLIKKKLSIRTFIKQDITKKYLSWLNDKVLLKYSRQKKKSHNFSTSLKYLKSFKKTKNLFLIILYKKVKIGTMTVYFKDNKKVANIGILIGDKKFQNKGFASRSIILLTKKYRKKNLFYYEIGTKLQNKKMIKVAKKCNFKFFKKNKKNIFFRKKILNKTSKLCNFK